MYGPLQRVNGVATGNSDGYAPEAVFQIQKFRFCCRKTAFVNLLEELDHGIELDAYVEVGITAIEGLRV